MSYLTSYPSGGSSMIPTMMKRRDLTWTTDRDGNLVSVGVVLIDETAQRIEPEHKSDHVPDGVTLHQPPGVRRPLVAG